MSAGGLLVGSSMARARQGSADSADLAGEEDGSATRPTITLRMLVPDDMRELRALQEALFPVKYSDTFYSRLLAGAPRFYTVVACCADAALLGGAGVVGVAAARIDPSVQGKPSESYLMTFGVDEQYRRKGIGSRILEVLEDILWTQAHSKALELHVKIGNNGALKFYSDVAKFNQVATLPNHYLIEGVQHGALHLRKDLRRQRGRSGACAGSFWCCGRIRGESQVRDKEEVVEHTHFRSVLRCGGKS